VPQTFSQLLVVDAEHGMKSDSAHERLEPQRVFNRCDETFCFNPLTPELNPSVQRCLTRFLLEILLLEPCILLIYA
jgi:hypothetical protein